MTRTRARCAALALLLAACRSGIDVGTLPSDGAAEGGLDGRAAAAPSWVVAPGGGPSTSGNGIGIDAAGNVYVGGTFNGQLTLGATVLSTNSTDLNIRSPFVARLDRQGSFVWAVQGRGVGDVTGLAIDAAGNTHVVGWFDYGLELGSTLLTASTPSHGLFIAKLDPQGQVLWAISPQGDFTYSRAIALDTSGNVHVAGSFTGAGTFGSIAAASPGPQTSAIFVAKLTPGGSFVWVTLAPSLQSSTVYPNDPWAIAVDGDGGSVVTGYFSTPFAVGSTTLSRKGNQDLFLARLDAKGQHLWATSGWTASSAWGTSVAVDGKGHGYVSGWASADTVGALRLGSRTASVDSDAFVARFATSSGDFDWIAVPGGTSGSMGGLVTDGQGNVYVGGINGQSMSFGSTTFPSSAMFIARADSSGAFTWVTTATTAFAACKNCVMALARDRWGGLFATGGFMGGAMTLGATTTTATEGLIVWKVTPP
jgi:large repetitive protein